MTKYLKHVYNYYVAYLERVMQPIQTNPHLPHFDEHKPLPALYLDSPLISFGLHIIFIRKQFINTLKQTMYIM